MTAGRPITAPRVSEMNSIAPGPNILAMKGWRERLIKAADGVSYAEIQRRAVRADGSLMPYATIRHVFTYGSPEIEVSTLAAICDALGVSLATITGRPHDNR